MTGPGADDPAAQAAALRRRVLLTGLTTLLLFTAAAFAVAAAGLSDLYLVLALALIAVVVIRPMLAPVRLANRERRARAYQAFLQGREEQQ